MPVTELLFSGDTTEQGRVIINDAYTQDCIWTGSTGDFTGITKNIITNNDGNNIISGDSSANSSVVEYSSILAGRDNTIFGQAPSNTTIKNSSIVAGNSNLITHNGSNVDIENCVIVGGADNAITGTSDVSNTVILGGQGLTGNTSDTVYTENIQSFGARIRNNKKVTVLSSSYVSGGFASFKIEDEDEHFIVYNFNLSTPGVGEWNVDVSNLVFGNSKVGRVIDIIHRAIGLFPVQPLILGADAGAGNYYINGTLNTPFTISNSNYVSVRIVVSKIVGVETYLEVYGTGA